jgi:hypothetical protein
MKKVIVIMCLAIAGLNTANAIPVRLTERISNVSGGQSYTWHFSNLPAHEDYPHIAVDRSLLGGALTFFWTLDNIPGAAFKPVQIDIDGVLQTEYAEVTPHPWDFNGLYTRYWFEHTLQLDFDTIAAITADGNVDVTISSIGISDPSYNVPSYSEPRFYPLSNPNQISATLSYNHPLPDETSTVVLMGTAMMTLIWFSRRFRGAVEKSTSGTKPD